MCDPLKFTLHNSHKAKRSLKYVNGGGGIQSYVIFVIAGRLMMPLN
jgi:hypothetical protein